MNRLIRKLRHTRSWVHSSGITDLPTAILLSACRTRQPFAANPRLSRFQGMIPRLRLHPRSLQGFSIDIDPSDVAELMIYEECFVDGIYDFSVVTFEPDVVIDCGGFEGYFTLLAGARFPSAALLAFEPHPENYKLMCRNFERNGIKVDARREAVSNRNGEMSFLGAGFSGRLATAEVDDDTSMRVPVVNLCKIIDELAPARLLLKLDVEGEEKHLIPELVHVLPPTSALFFESHDGDEAFDALAVRLQEAGFAVSRKRTRADRFIDAFAARTSRN
jgi:FkbM family methyltransferase